MVLPQTDSHHLHSIFYGPSWLLWYALNACPSFPFTINLRAVHGVPFDPLVEVRLLPTNQPSARGLI